MIPALSGGTHGRAFGYNVSPREQILYVSEGDSITSGGAAGTVGYAVRYKNANPGRVQHKQMAVAGSTLADIAARAATADGHIASYPYCQTKILSVMSGDNDFYNPVGTFLTNFAAYCDARRSAGFYVVVGTPTARGPGATPVGSAATESWRATAIADISGWVGVHCDAIMPFGSDPVMGTYAAAQDTSLYLDQVHPTDAGQIILMNIQKYVVNAPTVGRNPAEYQTWSTTDKNANITLSGSNYIASGSVTAFRTVRATNGRDSGKRYTEFLLGGSNSQLFGLASFTDSLSSFIGQSPQSAAIFPYSSGMYVSGPSVTIVNAPVTMSYVTGDRCCVAVDFDLGYAWYYRNGDATMLGYVNAGTNPSISFTPNQMMWPAVTLNDAASTCRLPANAGEIMHTKPTGYFIF